MDSIKFTGRVLHVMESWPLELKIRSDDGVTHNVVLAEDCEISLRNSNCDVSQVVPDANVEFTVQSERPAVVLKLNIL